MKIIILALITYFQGMVLGNIVIAQNNDIAIYYDKANQSDTIDFGYVQMYNERFVNITIENRSMTETYWIKDKDAAYVNILMNIGDQNDQFRAFTTDSIFQQKSLIIEPNSKVSFYVKFSNSDTTVAKSTIGKKTATLLINVYKQGVVPDTNTKPAKTKSFYLVGNHINEKFRVVTPVLKFFNSYVSLTKILDFEIQNATNNEVLYLSYIDNSKEFEYKFDTLIDYSSVLPQSTKVIPISFTPKKQFRYIDSVFLVIKDATGTVDSFKVMLEGEGVRFKVSIDKNLTIQANSKNNLPQLEITEDEPSDLLDLGNIPVFKDQPFVVVLKNTGSFKIEAKPQLAGIPDFSFNNTSTNDTITLKAKDQNNNNYEYRYISLNFKPQKPGVLVAQLTLDMLDTLQKIYGLSEIHPENMNTSILIRGTGSGGKISITAVPQVKSYINRTNLTSCPMTFPVEIENTGNLELTIDSITLAKNQNFKSISQTPFTVPIGFKLPFLLQFKASQPANFDDILTIYSNATNIRKLEIYLQGQGLEYVLPKIYTPNVLARDNQQFVKIPMYIGSEYLDMTNEFSAKLQVDSNTLIKNTLNFEPNDFSVDPSFTKNCTFDSSSVSGTKKYFYNISIKSTDDFSSIINTQSPYSQIGELMFKVYLSEHFKVPITLTDVRLSNSNCGDFFKVISSNDTNHGYFFADSSMICNDSVGISNIFNQIRKQKVVLAVQQQDESVANIQHFIPQQEYVEIALYSLNGEKVLPIYSGIASKDLQSSAVHLAGLSPGIYYCIMKSSSFVKGIPLLIQ